MKVDNKYVREGAKFDLIVEVRILIDCLLSIIVQLILRATVVCRAPSPEICIRIVVSVSHSCEDRPLHLES